MVFETKIKKHKEAKEFPKSIYFVGKDFWGRNTYEDFNGKKYKMVDGKLHYVTSEGEPESPVHSKFKIFPKRTNAWNVSLNHKNIDRVYYNANIKKEDVKESLINHDGYDSNIKLNKAKY